uniref:(northern house mosquito) hypothetical protein n=1 Tax=Culex pipiens TaxID=7175 RepID=A0A8D8EBT8_CULPI
MTVNSPVLPAPLNNSSLLLLLLLALSLLLQVPSTRSCWSCLLRFGGQIKSRSDMASWSEGVSTRITEPVSDPAELHTWSYWDHPFGQQSPSEVLGRDCRLRLPLRDPSPASSSEEVSSTMVSSIRLEVATPVDSSGLTGCWCWF